MSIDTEIKNAVNAADADAKYDERAKRLLGNKFILAHILVKTINEFQGMEPKDVVSYIEGEPFIGVVPVDDELRKDVSEMCNLSQGILEKGEAIGEAKGRAEMILSMYKKGYTIEQIAEVAEMQAEEVEDIIKKRD